MYDHNCKMCVLHEECHTVCMEASGHAIWKGMIVGEAPGAQEDDQGTPFIGRSGRTLDNALRAASGLSTQLIRKKIVVTNAVKCRPPGNRNPTKAELTACLMYLRREIQAHQPVAILALGNIAAWQLLEREGITRLREEKHFLDTGARVYVTFHPSFILRQGTGSDAGEMFKADVCRFVDRIKR
jgi:DNA polymerase